MKNNLSEKVLYVVTILLFIATILLCLNYPFRNSIYLFILVFGTVFWQRKKLQSFFQKIKNQKIIWAFYILTGWIWMIFFEFQLDRLPFNPKPIANLIIGLGFYLPYFAIWLILIKRYQFSLLEIFYLSGLGGLLFDLLITHKILTAAASTTYTLATFLVIISQTIVTLVLHGLLTALPVLYLVQGREKRYDKPSKEYLIGLTPHFLTTGVFIIWVVVLKIIFT